MVAKESRSLQGGRMKRWPALHLPMDEHPAPMGDSMGIQEGKV